MTPLHSFEEFKQFARDYQSFPWEISEEDEFQAADVKGKHSVLVNLVRFWKVISAVAEVCPDFKTVIDVGPYPGAMIKILRHYFATDFAYWAVGLGFSPEYCSAMEVAGGKCFQTELDPDFPAAAEVREWPIADADCVLLLDVIEHLVNPISCLDAANRALRMGGTLILTTDNITSFANTYQMIRRGLSPNIHPMRSSMFYRGEWRPHFRELSEAELSFYLAHAGFTVVRHEFFERRQGDYEFGASGWVQARNRRQGIKGLVQRAILRAAPHLMDHQIVIARKATAFPEVVARRPMPTTSKAEWLKMRSQLGL